MHVRDYIEHLRRKPAHVRQRIALGTSAGITGLIAAAYVVSLAASGALVTPEAPSTDVAASASLPLDDLVGAAAAFRDIASEAGSITVVETEAESTLEASETGSDKTVIPF